MDKNSKRDEIVQYFTSGIKRLFIGFKDDFWDTLVAVRFTVGSPLIVETESGRTYLGIYGLILKAENAYIVTKNDVDGMFELITKSSIYAFGRYVNEGYVTLSGGNRVGITGNCTMVDGKIISMSEISSLNFRIAHEKTGVSDYVIGRILKRKGRINNTLIISPPGCGKTTFLRDIARSLGTYEKSKKIIVCAIIDERYELGCASDGRSNLDVGQNNFVISGCSKSVGIQMVTRSMAPDVIIVDELWGDEDYKAAFYAKNSGCSIIASAHGENEEINEFGCIECENFFETIIVLSSKNGPGTIEKIIGG